LTRDRLTTARRYKSNKRTINIALLGLAKQALIFQTETARKKVLVKA